MKDKEFDCDKLSLLSGDKYLDIFKADGDSLITRPQHLGIVNNMVSVGINHYDVGVLDGLWAIPYVSSNFYLEPRLWGERVKTEHYTWLPFQTQQVGIMKGIRFKSTTTLIYKKRAGVTQFKLKNTTNEKSTIPIQFIVNNPFSYCVSLDKEDTWGFDVPRSRSYVENVSDGNGLIRKQRNLAIALGVDMEALKWEEPTRRFYGTVAIEPGQEIETSVVFSIGEAEDAVNQRNEILSDIDRYIQDATDYYREEVKNIFENLPEFSADNKDLEKSYYRSLSIFITNKFSGIPELKLDPYYGTGAIKGGCICNYLWNFGQVYQILHLLDPQAAKKHIISFIESGCLYNGYAFSPLDVKGFGTWYMINQEKIIRHVYYYIKLTGDIGFLSESVIGGKTIKEVMIENALYLDDISQPVKLINYGTDYGAANSHLELRREYKYNHVMPDLNGRRYLNYLRVAEMCQWLGEPEPLLNKRAEELKTLLKEILWEPATKWFSFINAEGKKEVRYQAQMFKLLEGNVLDEEQQQGLLSHLNEREFLSSYGLHSMSKLDPAYDQVDIDNGGGGNCTSFTLLIIEFLYNKGQIKEADDLLNRILWWGTRMPYFSDSQPANEIDYRQDTPLQSNISTGCLAQCVIFGLFGIDVSVDGKITIDPPHTKLSKKMSLKGLKLRNRTLDIYIDNGKYDVVTETETYTQPLGLAVVLL